MVIQGQSSPGEPKWVTSGERRSAMERWRPTRTFTKQEQFILKRLER